MYPIDVVHGTGGNIGIDGATAVLQSEGVSRADFCDYATIQRLVQLLGAPRRAVAQSAASVLAQTCGATHLRQTAAAEAGAVGLDPYLCLPLGFVSASGLCRQFCIAQFKAVMWRVRQVMCVELKYVTSTCRCQR